MRSAGGRAAVCGAHRRAESRFWGVFIIAVHRAFVLGLGARHRGIAELSREEMCVTVFAFFTYLLTYAGACSCSHVTSFVTRVFGRSGGIQRTNDTTNAW